MLRCPNWMVRKPNSRPRAIKPDLRVVFTTGYTDEYARLNQMIEAGAVFLQKPYSPESLARTVRNVIDAGETRLPKLYHMWTRALAHRSGQGLLLASHASDPALAILRPAVAGIVGARHSCAKRICRRKPPSALCGCNANGTHWQVWARNV